jgi:GNAT superfamily N-acetyltransferase
MSEVIFLSGKENMDVQAVHRYLSNESYWSKGIPFELVDRAMSNSFCLGAFIDGAQVGFARVITDYYTFGWLADVYVLPEHRGLGISKKMMSFLQEQDWCKRLRRMMLNTSTAHGLYTQFGFTAPAFPEYLMEVYQPDIHLKYRSEEDDRG